MNIVEEARASRVSPASLRMDSLYIQGKDPEAKIFIAEGKDDIGVYESWIMRSSRPLRFHILNARGKDEVLKFYEYWDKKYRESLPNVFFLIDKDFDGAKGHKVCRRVYITRAYSIENYLVSLEMIDSFLNDELQCNGKIDTKNRIKNIFVSDYMNFSAIMVEPNRRIFFARERRLSIAIEEKIKEYSNVSIGGVRRVWDNDCIEGLISGVDNSYGMNKDEEKRFVSLKPFMDYRGKFAYEFLVKWLASAVTERKHNAQGFFDSAEPSVRCNPGQMRKRDFASRVSVPEDLEEYLKNIVM